MACNNCTATYPIPECTELLTIGSYSIDTPIYIFVRNEATGYLHRQESTTDSEGLIQLDMGKPDPSFYNKDQSYTLWITEQDSSPDDTIDITIGEGTFACFNISFFPVFNEEDINTSYETITLRVYEDTI